MDDRDDQQSGAFLTLTRGAKVARSDVDIRFVLSSGPGGQNVNKRATSAQLRVRVSSIVMNEPARGRLRELAGSFLTNDDELLITRDETRSQKRNKDACVARLRELVRRAMVPPRVRRKTKPTKGSIQRRLDEKKRRGQIKRNRKRPKGDE